MTWRRWLSFAVFSLTAPLAVRPAAAQLAPTGGHYANQPSDTGFTGGVNSSGGYSASIPLDLPGARGGLPVPVSVVYGGGGVGAAGLGWDVPLSYIRRDNTIAHRRPKQASASSPQWARERVSLVLEGRAMELVQTGSEWVARRDAPELVVREQSDGTWVAYDGQGRTYLFAVVDPALNGADLWLLKTITGTGGSRVQLDYTITSPTVGTIAGIAIDLTRVSYNPHPTMANCYKNTVVLHYDGPAATPLSISVLGDRLLVRMHKLDGLNVTSKETCGGNEVVLRGYQLQHEADGDTQLPRLHSVHVVGRDGTPENGTPLPIATYSYGTATSSGSLQYQLLSAVAAPGFGEPYTVNGGQPIPPFGVPFGTYGGLLDLTGDGLPETIVSDFIERGLTIIPDWLHSYSEQNLLGSVLLRGPHEIHSLSQERYKKPPSADLVWRQAIDVNGDGRLDIVDAATEIGHWVVYLNVPDLTIDSTVRWARRSYSTQALETYLTARGLHVDAGRVPLARRWTAEETVTKYCWTWPAGGIEWTVTDCGTTTSQHTFTEWETNDINGDGYPDLVMNSSPVISVTQAPPPPPTPPEDPTVRHNVTRTVRVTPTLAATNEIDAVFNVLGVHIDLDSQPFSPPVLLAANDKCGVAQWNEADSTHQALQCGIVDVNGDGLADRVSARAVRLGTGTFGTNGFFTTSTVLSLPGSLAVQENDLVAACTTAGSGAIGFTTHLTAGLHDLTGDGIPDYVWQGATGQWSAAIGTGTGFLSSIPINGVFALSSQVDRCDGFISATTTGLYDVDGDGKPDVVTSDPDASGNSALVYKLVASGGVLGAPEAGRLVQVDNGFGAITNITYRSAKLLLDPNSSARAATSIHQVPFPEIVVSSVQTTLPRGPQNQNRNLAPVQYAYGGAELVFDPVADRFTFPGYRRRVALSVPLEDQNGTATITDIYEPANPADPYDLGTTSLTPAQRYARDLRIGRVSDVSVLSGNVGTDPSALLAVNVTTDERRIATTHDEYDAKLLPDASNAPEACNEMVYPYDYKRSREVSKEEDINACRQRGFAFATSVQSFRGAPGAAPGADASVTTRSEVKTIDDFGRVTSAKQLGDTTRTDDDLCIETEYANATGQNERVLSAAAKRSVTDCGTTIYAKDTWEYDKLAVGSVSAGLPTAHTVERRDDTGKLLGEVLREFDATFDAAGNPEKMTTSRDGATRTATVEYDPFKLVPVKLKTEASGVPTMQISLTRHPLTLSVTTSQDLNETTRGTTFDGFDRLVLTTVTPPGGTEGALSCTTYRGFDGSDSQGRSVTSKVFTDVVAPATACTATGRTATVHLDELGRARVTEQVLGTSYPNVTMKVDQTYDSLGRLVFATDPYPSNQNAATAYGTTQYFNADGTPLCTIRGKGKQPRPQPQSQPTDPPTPMVTDEANEVYPTCFSRSFREHLEVFSVRDAASLLPNSPQDGVVKYSYFTPMGRLTARTTWKGSTRLEYATFTQDPLGHLASMERSQTATSADTVKSSWHTDSLGQVVELDEPDSPAQFNVYSNWGELIETKRTVNGSVKRVVQKYDALGRVIHSEQQTGGVVDPETVHDYAYDTAVQVSPHVTATNVLGRLAQATWPTGSVTYSYDGLGRNNAQVFTDAQGGNYVEKHTFHGDGSLDVLDLFLPDTAYADEQIKYTYDSAGRGRNVTYTNGTSQDLYHASTIDPFGRVREAKYGPATYTADYADVGRRLMRSVAVASPPKARSISYSGFDPLGRERSRTEIKDGTGSGATTTWAYDALGRLSSAVQTGGTTNFNQQFTYDQIGNLLTVTNTGTDATNTALTYSTTDRDRICHIAFGNDTNTACNVTYDELGSILSQPTPNGSREYTYLVDGSVRKITDDRGSIANFRYDAFGQVQELDLTSNTSTDEREDHHFGSLITLRKEKPNGASGSSPILTRKIPLHDGSVATRHGSGGPWTFEYGEPRGNRFFTDETGAFVQDVDYQPFGKPTSTGAQPGSQLYSNKQWNGGDALAAFGISKLGARLYDPAIGRFLSRDPLLIPRTAATTNPYAFAMNDPVNLSDPSGLQAVEPLGQPFIVKKYERGPTGGNPLQPTPDVTADSDVAEGTFVFNPEIPWEDRDPFANAQGPDTQRGSSHSDTPSTVQEAIRKTSAPARAVMAMMYPMFRTDGVAAAADRFARGVAADVVMVGGTTAGGIVGGAAGPAGAVLGAALGAGIAYPFAEWIRGETPTLSGQLTASAFGATFEVGGRVAGNLFSRLLTAALSRACFAAGTLVTTSRGALPIEEVHSGDYVWSRDEKTGVEAWMPVVRTFVTPDKPVLALTLSDTDGNQEQLSVTSEHPFWTQDGWKRAGDLHGGDRVLALSGWTEVLLVIDTGRNETVYNLEVAEFHTYFAGHIGFWVHNDCVAVARAISRSLASAGCKFECFKHAEDLISALRGKGIQGIELTLDVGDKWVYSNTHGALGVQGAVHKAVQVGDFVFDNMHPSGIRYSDWIRDFGGPVFTRSPHAELLTKSF